MSGASWALELTKDQAADLRELARESDKTLKEVSEAFGEMLADALEHPFRQTLPRNMSEILQGIAALPDVDLSRLPIGSREIVKGWVLHNALMLTFIHSYLETVNEEA